MTKDNKQLNIDQLRIDGDIQPREELDQDTVSEYADRMKNGDKFPPMLAFHDGSDYWLVDGFHRFAAYARNDTHVVFAEVRNGTKRDAALAAVECNATHGKRRSNADKRRSVMRLLEDAEWGQWSDREIARRCGVSYMTVSRMRPSLSQSDSEEGKTYGELCGEAQTRAYTTKHGTTATMNTSNIGKSSSTDDEYEEVVIDEDTGEVIENASVIKTTVKQLKHGGPSLPVSDALTFASIAISQLERIMKDDPKRREAIVSVRDWINGNL